MSEPGFYEWTRALPDLLALVGDRIYPERLPQHHFDDPATMPAIVWLSPSSERQKMFCGTDGLKGVGYQFDFYAVDRDQCKALADAFSAQLEDYSGPMGEVNISSVSLDTEFTLPPEPNPGLYRRTQLYTIWHT